MDPARPTSLPATGSGGHTDFTYPVRVRRICITYSLMLGTTRLFGFVHQHGPDRRYPGQMVALRNRGERWLGHVGRKLIAASPCAAGSGRFCTANFWRCGAISFEY